MKKFIKEYWVELFAVAVLFLAGLLLLLRNRVGSVGQGVASTIRGWFSHVYYYFAWMSTTELLAWFMVIAGTLFILWRLRYRFLKSDRWQELACPKCGSKLHRIHRTSLDRLVGSIFLPRAARYRCSNKECGWSGLRQTRQGSAAALQSQNSPGDPGNQG